MLESTVVGRNASLWVQKIGMKAITAVGVDIDKDAVYRRLGYKNRSPSAAVLSAIDSQMPKAYKLIKPMFTYELKAVEDVVGQEVFLSGSLVFSSKTLSYVLSDCKWGSIYLVTIGKDLDEQMARLMERGEMLKATILDAIGTEAVAQILYKLWDVIKGIAKANGSQATVQYAPGYCDWHVSQQKVLFQAIDSDSLGVRLTETCMMIPQKSISGVIGIGKFDATKAPPCLAVCDKRTYCSYRRLDWNPGKQSLLL